MEGGKRALIYLTGGILAIVVLIHLSLFSFWFVEGGYYTNMEWEAVSSRMSQALWDIFYLIFLATVLSHSYLGIRNIVFEVVEGEGGRRIVSIALAFIWIVAFLYGLLPILAGG